MDDRTKQQWIKRLEPIGQGHLLRSWTELSADERAALVADLGQIPFGQLAGLIETHVRSTPPAAIPEAIEPVEPLPALPGPDQEPLYRQAWQRGEQLIRENRVAALTVAGGQGSRLGFDGPKGAYRISPVANKPLFQLFAEGIQATRRRYGAPIRWYIMTSPTNDAETKTFFAEHDHFGLPASDVVFFTQGQMPALSPDGKILLDEKHRIALSPDGHGGTLLALARSGALRDMADCGIEHLSYFQVDNPLVHVIDPLFIGLHAQTGSEMSSKTIPKANDLEKVGNFVRVDGKVMVIEYSDLPDELAKARTPDGKRRFDAGSIAIHVIRRSFVERLTADPDRFGLPWHRAEKKVPYINEAGERVTPDAPNAIKLETFIFDALPLAENPLVLLTERAEEFSPVKNATGVDSAETSRRDMVRRAAAWLECCGLTVPRNADGEPAVTIEISPTFALDRDALCTRRGEVPALEAGQTLVLQ